MTIHQKCPYCDRLFEIGPKDYRPLRRHIAFTHSEGEGSASETAVGAIAGLGAALGVLNRETLGVVTWWLISPVVVFWLSAVIGCYLQPNRSDARPRK